MTTLLQLENFVVNIIQDTAFTSAMIRAYLNQGVMEIAGGMQSEVADALTPPLPGLYSIGSVETVTDAAFVAMPATFQRDLTFAANENNTEIDIANSMIGFTADNPLLTRSGRINEVIEQGGNLYYQGIPAAAETVALHFHRLPVDMTDDDDTPDGIPAHLQTPLLVNFACWEIFKLIEDGLGDQPVNTSKHEKMFKTTLKTLELFIPFDTRSFNLGD